MIEFLLNGQLQRVVQGDPNCTLLDHLREHLHQTGTKEGCASGDCGACTLAMGELCEEPGRAARLRYRSINACITPLVAVHGCALVTVEGLASGEALHPAQQAMVDCHGSQCGFCTPGFVMSLFVLGQEHAQAPPREEILAALGGNLCRCTGYRPIVDAAVRMFDPQLQQPLVGECRALELACEADWCDRLREINRGPSPRLQGGSRLYFAPASSVELGALLRAYPNARLMAGATDLALELTQKLQSIEVLVSTARVADMRQLEVNACELRIGAAVTYSDFAPLLLQHYPHARELLERLGSRQIRNRGTLGGNLGNASPIGDMPPLLLALDARLRLYCGGERRELPVAEFFRGYKRTALRAGEFIEQVIIPRPQAGERLRVYKISKRFEDDISTTCGAFWLRLEADCIADVRIAFGGMADTPRRAPACERALRGSSLSAAGTLDDSAIADAMGALATDFEPISDFRASAAYRLQVSQNLLRRLQLELADPAATLRVYHHA
ncbi:xanthine dehydrogenase small subunit [Microbulbifer bruguierae]|uniref:Xanthine dehydrogenase small subunit n=1 Tax=Microbulbifer bruguierae TaxID=3029061 RepID=A0ABY8N8G1_9GAMM|nr:xanthine dehydrogenase small subunit [Microbulbifer bruguierae]WGL15176.1 xanthine dehydrogenase small subunit [Microbulbifer bruguierae]